MSQYPYAPVEVAWKRPPIDRETLKRLSRRSDLKGLAHCVGAIAVIGASGVLSYWLFATGRWALMAAALYVHGALFAFNPRTHELAHGTMFGSRWLNGLFKRIFGIIHWSSNSALYWMSHRYHHRYTVHRQGDGEVVLPYAETTDQVLHRALQPISLNGLVSTIYDQLYAIFRPYLASARNSAWQRYVYEQATEAERRDAYWTMVSQLGFHLLFAAVAIAAGRWFLIVVVTLPAFYGGGWYHMLVHDTMHVGRTPETDDFRDGCRSVRVDPFTSFVYWHMEWHTEHHAYPAIPCYNLGRFHRLTAEHWERPQSLVQAWREMNRESRKLLGIG